MTATRDVQVSAITFDEKPILRQFLEMYDYDFSVFEGTNVFPRGLYDYRYLDH